jgi:hypothetical protein
MHLDPSGCAARRRACHSGGVDRPGPEEASAEVAARRLRRQAAASDTLERTALAEGSWTVLWHSIVRQYLDDAQHAAVAEGIARLGAAATPSARFAWLALEPHRHTPNGECLVTLTTWPGGTGRVLGTAPPHGLPVLWSRS